MRKNIKITSGTAIFIRCDRFECKSVFKSVSNSIQKNIKEARLNGWVLGKKDHCKQCHQDPFRK